MNLVAVILKTIKPGGADPGTLALLQYCNVMTHRRPGFSMEPSIMLGIVPSAPALSRVVAILMTFIWYIRNARAQPWRQQEWRQKSDNNTLPVRSLETSLVDFIVLLASRESRYG
jgi:hypothetical protein